MFDSHPTRTARLWLAALSLAAAWLALPAQAQQPKKVEGPQTPAALYQNYCSVCHGEKGDGNSQAKHSMKPAPRDFTSPRSAADLTRERMVASVKNGVPNTGMASWKKQLTDKQVNEVVDYVRHTFMRPSITDGSHRGRQIYARVCSVCHGERGNGSMWASANLKPAPRDFTTQIAKDELTRDRMIASVTRGRPNTPMQGYGTRFSLEEREAVIDYIREAFMGIRLSPAEMASAKKPKKADGHDHSAHSHAGGSAADHAAHGHNVGPLGKDGKVDMKAVFAKGLKGDPVAGGKMYEANCATCHGAKGDGQGPRAYFINPKPRVFTNDDSRATLNRPTIYDGVATGRRGSEMPAWDKVLTPQEIADVAEYVFRSFIQVPNANVAKKK
jgi:mono/diheme cytochrome c family protein